MLVIDRKNQEEVKVFHNGEEMTIIVAIQNGKVKLVFGAPKSFSIWRSELLDDGKRPQHHDDVRELEPQSQTTGGTND